MSPTSPPPTVAVATPTPPALNRQSCCLQGVCERPGLGDGEHKIMNTRQTSSSGHLHPLVLCRFCSCAMSQKDKRERGFCGKLRCKTAAIREWTWKPARIRTCMRKAPRRLDPPSLEFLSDEESRKPGFIAHLVDLGWISVEYARQAQNAQRTDSSSVP